MHTALEHVERMEALVRRMARRNTGLPGLHALEDQDEAKAIVADMKADTDLLEARRYLADRPGVICVRHIVTKISVGQYDGNPILQAHLTGIKRGRELAE